MSNPLTNLHWFNIPGLSSKPESTSNKFLVDVMKLSKFDGYPFFLHMGNGRLREIENLLHQQHDIEILNSVGVHIFLYEPICSYIDGTKFNRGFYSDILFEQSLSTLRAVELDSILAYVKNNNLTKVTVHSCDYNISKFFPYYNTHMRLICDDLFIKNHAVFETNIEKKLEKKFICVNWRHTKHRHLITASLANKSCFYSWYFKSTFDVLKDDLYFNLDAWQETSPSIFNQIKQGLETLNSNCPSILDISAAESVEILDSKTSMYPVSSVYAGFDNPAKDNPRNKILEKFYNGSFCDIVNESRFAQHTANFSEKLFQPIRYKTPWILVAPPKTLEYAKKYGFKSFGEFWDESYDDCWNHEERLLKIIRLINYIDSLSMEELSNLYINMQDVLEHNYNILVEKSPSKTVQKIM